MTVHPISLNQMRPMRFGDGGISLNGNAKAPATPQATTPDPSESPTRHIIDSSETHIAFNVMPDRPVREQLRMRQFRVGATWIEAEFDRTYSSSMLNSPSHLTFVAALVQMQKITYMYCCHRLGFDPDVNKPEVLKIWPTHTNITMRDLVREEGNLVHRMDFRVFRRLDQVKYLATATSRIGVLQIDASAIIHLLRAPCLNE